MYQSGETQRKSLNKTHKITEAVHYIQILKKGGQPIMQGQWEVGSCQEHMHSITGRWGGGNQREKETFGLKLLLESTVSLREGCRREV